MTNEELKNRIEFLESEGKFDEHLSEIDWNNAQPFDENFPYIPKGKLKLRYFFTNIFKVKPFTRYQAKSVYKLKVIGRKNLKGIKSAVIIANHIAIFDCLVNQFALRRKTKVVGAEFNNQKGPFGEYMRIGGLLPIHNKISVMKKFNQAVSYYLKKNQYVLFYPEQAMWNFYEKPRPFKNGPFYYATINNAPVVPIFTTYRKSGKFNEDGSEKLYFTVNIGKPILPDTSLTKNENIEHMKTCAYNACVEIYENTYNKKLVYNIKEK